MIRQGHEWATGEHTERCEVVVIGSGPAGTATARRLAELGRDVIVVDRSAYGPGAGGALARIEDERGLERSDDGAVSLTFGRAALRGDLCRPPPDRLERWALPGHDLAALAPWFERIEREREVRPPVDDPGDPMDPGDPVGARVRAAATSLGWRVAHASRAHREPGELGARIYCDLDAVRLLWDGASVSSVVTRALDRTTGRPSGAMVHLEADAVVLAAGGLGTPRFLLKQGLKERLPHVGEHLSCDPSPTVHALLDAPIAQWRSAPTAWVIDEFRRARFDGERYLEGGYLLMPSRLPPGVLAAMLPGIGERHRALLRELPRLGGIVAWVDDDEEGRLTLESGGRTRLHFPLKAGSALRIRDAWMKQAALLLEAGAREVLFGDAADTRITARSQLDAAVAAISLEPAHHVLAAPHPGGGARMGASPRDSVVGFDHRVHESANLYVSDPSVFPSPVSVDPALTILAFAQVAADHVHAAL